MRAGQSTESLPFRENASVLRILAALFVVTGAVGLLAEQSFERMLGTLLGTSTPAGAVVLAVYFGGLTIGSASYRRLSGFCTLSPLRTYALIEAGVGAWALALFLGFDLLPKVFSPLLALGSEVPLALALLRGIVALAWIFPPTFLMGASFPAIVDALEALRVPRPGTTMASFYSLNVAGAVAAAAAGPYLFFPLLGLDGTLLTAGALDFFVAAAAWRLDRRDPTSRAFAPAVERLRPAPTAPFSRPEALLIAVAGISGFLFFSLEVLWIHLLQIVIGNSVFAFAAMLFTVLAGLGIGGMLVSRILPTRTLPVTVPAALCLLSALSLSLLHSRWPLIPARFVRWGGLVTTFAGGEAARWTEVLLQIGPTAVVLGALYPCLFRLDIFPGHDRAATAGRLGAANAAGCVLGALTAAFLLLSRLGSEASLLAITGAYALCGGALLLVAPPGRTRVFTGLATLAVLAVTASRPAWDLLALTSGQHVYLRPGHVGPASRLLSFHEDASGGATTVVADPVGAGRFRRTLLTNGKFQGNDTGEVLAQTAVALLPILHAPGFDSALVIGLGTGRSAAIPALLGYRNVDIAEIAPGIVEAARTSFAEINASVLDRPNVRLLIEDGRNALLLRPSTYDLVSMEVSSVWFAGSTNLYSREFYEVVRNRLRPGGVFQQWIQVHHIGRQELLGVLATVHDVFPHVTFWFFGGQGIIVASPEPLLVRTAALARFRTAYESLGFPPERAAEVLKTILSSRLLSAGDTDALARRPGLARNTDRNRWLEYATPRYNLDRNDHVSENVRALASLSSFQPHEVETGAPGDPLVAIAREISRSDFLRFFGLPDLFAAGQSRLPPAGGSEFAPPRRGEGPKVQAPGPR